MKTRLEHCPAQVRQSCHLEAGTEIVAIAGTLRLRWHDRSMDGLLDAAPVFALTLHEGESHRLAAPAMVEFEGLAHGADVAILQPERRFAWRRLRACLHACLHAWSRAWSRAARVSPYCEGPRRSR